MITGYTKRNKRADTVGVLWITTSIICGFVAAELAPLVLLAPLALLYGFLAYQHFCPAHFAKGYCYKAEARDLEDGI